MDEHKRSVGEELEYQLATRYFASAFEHCDRLPVEDQQSLLGEISNQTSKRLAAAALRGEWNRRQRISNTVIYRQLILQTGRCCRNVISTSPKACEKGGPQLHNAAEALCGQDASRLGSLGACPDHNSKLTAGRLLLGGNYFSFFRNRADSWRE
jgi:hypothetical protein